MTGKTGVWPVKSAIRPDIVRWPAVICSPGYTLLITFLWKELVIKLMLLISLASTVRISKSVCFKVFHHYLKATWSYISNCMWMVVFVLFFQDGIMAGQQVEILQELEKMGNLESVVTEQKIRIEKLRTTYESLKAQHLQLQDVSDMNQEKHACMIVQLAIFISFALSM